ncbi:unnamed protein product, partial [Mesorhabditis spiculigera]
MLRLGVAIFLGLFFVYCNAEQINPNGNDLQITGNTLLIRHKRAWDDYLELNSITRGMKNLMPKDPKKIKAEQEHMRQILKRRKARQRRERIYRIRDNRGDRKLRRIRKIQKNRKINNFKKRKQLRNRRIRNLRKQRQLRNRRAQNRRKAHQRRADAKKALLASTTPKPEVTSSTSELTTEATSSTSQLPSTSPAQ